MRERAHSSKVSFGWSLRNSPINLVLHRCNTDWNSVLQLYTVFLVFSIKANPACRGSQMMWPFSEQRNLLFFCTGQLLLISFLKEELSKAAISEEGNTPMAAGSFLLPWILSIWGIKELALHASFKVKQNLSCHKI